MSMVYGTPKPANKEFTICDAAALQRAFSSVFQEYITSLKGIQNYQPRRVLRKHETWTGRVLF